MKKTVQKVKQPQLAKQAQETSRREKINPLDHEWDIYDGDDSDIVSLKHFYESSTDHRYF